MTFGHYDGYVVTIRGDDFIAAGSLQGLDPRSHTMDNSWTKSLGRIGPNCSQKSGKFIRRTVEFADGAHWWSQTPSTCGNASMSSAWPEAKAPSTPARKTRRRTLLKRWLECRKWSGRTSRGWQARCSITARTTQGFSSRWAMSDKCNPTVGVVGRLNEGAALLHRHAIALM